MIRKISLSLFVAISMMALLTAVVVAQQPDPVQTEQPSIDPLVTSVTQAVPVTLTVSIPGPGGVQTIEIPILINLDIQIDISSELTPSVRATTSVVITEPAGVEEEVAVEETPTPTQTPAPRTPTSTPAPTAVAATATPTSTEIAVVTVVVPACPDPRTVIASPGVNQVVSGTVNILGIATHESFDYYKVEYAEGADVDPGEMFAYLADANAPVIDGLLASFDSAEFTNGPYTLKLTVVDHTGNFPPPCTVTVVVEN